MEPKENKSNELGKSSKAELIALIASQIKGKILFPSQVEQARRILDRARFLRK
jgi:hypothetical protein